jgi:hypothetical protein
VNCIAADFIFFAQTAVEKTGKADYVLRSVRLLISSLISIVSGLPEKLQVVVT